MSGRPTDYFLITGGAGFIGTNLAHQVARQGKRVLIYDNLSRPGVECNLSWLQNEHPDQVTFWKADVRNSVRLDEALDGAYAVAHLAAQVAVTTSLENPIDDFEVNARGTLNLLEALRSRSNPPPLLYTSTNKVLGGLEGIDLVEKPTRYEPAREDIRSHGIGESWGIEFCSPYGCSKGAADQYVLDYSRNFGISAVVFRMSCIYGPHQCGNEDQGWVAHFVRQALDSKTINFYGDGKQVRDALFVDDLIDAILVALRKIDLTRGRAFNMGGGPQNTTSLLELVQRISQLRGQHSEVKLEPWRPSDQRYFVSDIRSFKETTGWEPQMPLHDGVERLFHWMKDSQGAAVRSEALT